MCSFKHLICSAEHFNTIAYVRDVLIIMLVYGGYIGLYSFINIDCNNQLHVGIVDESMHPILYIEEVLCREKIAEN